MDERAVQMQRDKSIAVLPAQIREVIVAVVRARGAGRRAEGSNFADMRQKGLKGNLVLFLKY